MECLVKSRFVKMPGVEFQLFESMLLEDGEYFLFAEHLERMRNSADYFGFRFPETINADLGRIAVEKSRGWFKVRLTLWKDGRIETLVSGLKPVVDLQVRLWATPGQSSGRFFFYQTT